MKLFKNFPRPANLAKLDEEVRQAQDELNARQAEAERKVAAARELQAKLEGLNGEVDRAEQDLALLDRRLEAFKGRLESMKTAFVAAWTNPSIPDGPVYRDIVSIEAAIADFPRIQAHYVHQLEAAKSALQAFELEHL